VKNKFCKYLNLEKPILLVGETGSGKSQFARDIFENSKIYKEKFLTLHMASLKEELIESELFGHKKGAFTGAAESKNGYFKEAGFGTLFIDEVGELSLEAQKKLLYSLEEKKYSPIGDAMAYTINCRIIMATNQNLIQLVRQKKFREDLYFRLASFQIDLPPLREILIKNKMFIESEFKAIAQKYNKEELVMSKEVCSFLNNYSWPGNFRELKNILENLVLLAEDKDIQIEQVPKWLNSIEPKASLGDFESFFQDNYSESIAKFERAYLDYKLGEFSGKINETARQIGISKTALIYKAKQYQINTLNIRAKAYEKSLDLAA
jgi:two-component system NtrC family response regulator